MAAPGEGGVCCSVRVWGGGPSHHPRPASTHLSSDGPLPHTPLPPPRPWPVPPTLYRPPPRPHQTPSSPSPVGAGGSTGRAVVVDVAWATTNTAYTGMSG